MKRFLISLLIIMVVQTNYADESSKLSVSGEATVYKPADMLSLSVGAETFDQDIKEAIQSNANKMQGVRDALLEMGLSEQELQTRDYTIFPQHTPTPQNPAPDWHPSIVGYEVRNMLEIRTSKLELAGNIIDVASGAGANFVQNISFSLQNEEQAKAEAIAEAFHNAEFYAQAVVREAGLKLGGISNLKINQSSTNIGLYKGGRNLASQEISTTISPREVEVSASVSVVYTIENVKEYRK